MLGTTSYIKQKEKLSCKVLEADNAVSWFLFTLPKNAYIRDIIFYVPTTSDANTSRVAIYRNGLRLLDRHIFDDLSSHALNTINLSVPLGGLVMCRVDIGRLTNLDIFYEV